LIWFSGENLLLICNNFQRVKIYTKTGDKGQTSLVGGKRVSKTDPRIEAYGTVDELISVLGLLKEMDINSDTKDVLLKIQHHLMVSAAILATDNESSLSSIPSFQEDWIVMIEKNIDEMNPKLSALSSFVIPGGSKEAATCHLARTICRRSERSVLGIQPFPKEYGPIEKYMNRLSDYLFVLARKVLADKNLPEILWQPTK